MSDYLTANRKKITAIIGLGDMVTGSIKRVFDQVGVKPGDIPVVGWGNSRDTTAEVWTAMSTPASGRTRRRRATWRLSSPSWRRPASPGIQHHRRHALRQDERRHVRQDHVGQVGANRSTRPGAATRAGRVTASQRATQADVFASSCPLRPVIRDLKQTISHSDVSFRRRSSARSCSCRSRSRFSRDQSRIPVGPQHQQHANFHRRARPHRARDDTAHDRGRIRSLRRLVVRFRAGRDVDALQRRAGVAGRRIRRSASWSRR